MYDKTMANLAMIRARKGPIIALATEGDTAIKKVADDVIYLPHDARTAVSDSGDRAAATLRLSHRRRARLRRGQAAQPGQERDGGMKHFCGVAGVVVNLHSRAPQTFKVRNKSGCCVVSIYQCIESVGDTGQM